jgi:GT2 family glycosyltransferase
MPVAHARSHASVQPSAADASSIDHDGELAEVIICVHNALPEVRRCLESVARHTAPRHSVIIVDDGSDPACHDELVQFARHRPRTALIHNDVALGYTKAANEGLRRSRAGFVVLLNSDTIVTSSWLERLMECASSDATIGMVGPLSNAAGYQSVPEGVTEDGIFVVNSLPPGWDPEQVAGVVAAVSARAFPRVGFLNGFCIGIKRAVVDQIGHFDDELFPEAYGEETDYCLRAIEAGFSLAVADHAYVYHAKSRSYPRERRGALMRAGDEALRQRHGRAYLMARRRLHADPTLAAMRWKVGQYLWQTCPLPAVSDAAQWAPSSWPEV